MSAIIDKILSKIRERPYGTKTVIIDETNDPGSRKSGSMYIIGATVLEEDEVLRFREITEKKYKGREFKFHKSRPKLRYSILSDISDLHLHVYVVTIRKPRFKEWTAGEKKNAHLNGFKKLIENIVKNENAVQFHTIIDNTSIIDEDAIGYLVDKNNTKHGKNMTFEISDSRLCFLIQTNDYVVGSVGKRYNRRDVQYFKALNIKLYRKRLLFNKTRSQFEK